MVVAWGNLKEAGLLACPPHTPPLTELKLLTMHASEEEEEEKKASTKAEKWW